MSRRSVPDFFSLKTGLAAESSVHQDITRKSKRAGKSRSFNKGEVRDSV